MVRIVLFVSLFFLLTIIEPEETPGSSLAQVNIYLHHTAVRSCNCRILYYAISSLNFLTVAPGNDGVCVCVLK